MLGEQGALNIFMGEWIWIMFNPTPVGGGGVFRPPYQKMAITPKNNDPKKPKLCDSSYISMKNPPVLIRNDHIIKHIYWLTKVLGLSNH